MKYNMYMYTSVNKNVCHNVLLMTYFLNCDTFLAITKSRCFFVTDIVTYQFYTDLDVKTNCISFVAKIFTLYNRPEVTKCNLRFELTILNLNQIAYVRLLFLEYLFLYYIYSNNKGI